MHRAVTRQSTVILASRSNVHTAPYVARPPILHTLLIRHAASTPRSVLLTWVLDGEFFRLTSYLC